MSAVLHHTSDTNLNIQLTESAQNHMISYLNKNPGHIGVRLSVKKTGCSGFSYVLDYVKISDENDLSKPLGDYVLFVDKASYLYMKNVQIDYIRQGLNFKLVFNNPNQTGQCGCGESFTINEIN
ncbi:MAG: iron-sulfur cluster assembly accessory protein [Legionella sp.]|nr:iron-sulfur cluster assembly accessory protein [Legionella sp.]